MGVMGRTVETGKTVRMAERVRTVRMVAKEAVRRAVLVSSSGPAVRVVSIYQTRSEVEDSICQILVMLLVYQISTSTTMELCRFPFP